MLRVGHYGVAMLAYAPVVFVLLESGHPGFAGLGLPLLFVMSRLPDVDRRLPFVRHRGPTHTVWFATLTGAPVAFASVTKSGHLILDVPNAFGIGIPVLGVLSHLIADSLTPAGIRPFWPFSSRLVSFHLVRAANSVANYGLFLLGVLGLCIACLAGVNYPGNP